MLWILTRFITYYALTNDANEEVKDLLWKAHRLKAQCLTILMGDMNAKIRSCNTGYEEVMGTHGLGDMNNNGERFPDLCAEDELVIGWSAFPQKKKKYTTPLGSGLTLLLASVCLGRQWNSAPWVSLRLSCSACCGCIYANSVAGESRAWLWGRGICSLASSLRTDVLSTPQL